MEEFGSVYVVDEMMGVGKSSAAINYINNSHDERFIVITPYLDEVQRYKESCSSLHFKEPVPKRGKKINDVKELLLRGENIVCTHSLFQRFDEEIMTLCKVMNYVLVMDEVAEVVQEFNVKQDDVNFLMNDCPYCYIDDNNLIRWKGEYESYDGDFMGLVKNLCDLGALFIVREKILLWLFPIKVFESFKKTFILTYLFNSQIQRYYYDYYGVHYSYLHVEGDSVENFRFTESPVQHYIYDYSSLIHILDNNRLNEIGEKRNALNLTWYNKYDKTAVLVEFKNHLTNFFRNIRGDNSKDNIWTTFSDFKGQLSGKGYTKGFIPLNMRATNNYRDRTSLAYTVNRYLHPMVKAFFQDNGVTVDEDGYALSEMLQWIWRSAIRDGKPIWIYIPSSRMRGLFQDWIDKVSGE